MSAPGEEPGMGRKGHGDAALRRRLRELLARLARRVERDDLFEKPGERPPTPPLPPRGEDPRGEAR